jgi:hypothetical protein
MARLLMGAIVTKAVGKIGGQCFRIKNQTQILQRNPNPFKNRAINKNPAMYAIRFIFNSWKNQGNAARATWAVIAANNPQPDRFGNMVNLSARDYYNQANINLFRNVGLFVNQNTYDASVPYINISSVTISTAENVFILNDFDVLDPYIGVLNMRVVNSKVMNPIASSLPFVTTFDANDYSAAGLYAACENAGINFVAGNVYAVGVRILSAWGVYSPSMQFTVRAI